ncbi:MAG: hypothetical protein L3K16_06200 [Thermoplasmata archaeon]|nr:hypothetical protein [Thermoplasmata archaeon]
MNGEREYSRTAPLKRAIRGLRAADDPLRVAIEGLPELVTQEQFLAQLRVLLPLVSLKEGL